MMKAHFCYLHPFATRALKNCDKKTFLQCAYASISAYNYISIEGEIPLQNVFSELFLLCVLREK